MEASCGEGIQAVAYVQARAGWCMSKSKQQEPVTSVTNT